MSNRKTWTYTEDPAILRNRITFLNKDLDAAERRISELTTELAREQRTSTFHASTAARLSLKLTQLITWLDDREPPARG